MAYGQEGKEGSLKWDRIKESVLICGVVVKIKGEAGRNKKLLKKTPHHTTPFPVITSDQLRYNSRTS